MGNSVSRVVGCFVPVAHDRERVAVFFSEPLDEGLGHSFCYVRPSLESPHLSPSPSDRYSVVPVPLADSEARSGSFRLSNSDNVSADKPRNLSETTFKSISGASVSANTSTPRTAVCHEQFHSFISVPDDRAAAFESTSSFSALPLQPIPRGVTFSGPISGAFSGPLERGFMSGPIERGLISGPLERGFMSGPLERGYMSGPMEMNTDGSHFSAPLAGPYSIYSRRGQNSIARFLSTVGKPMKGALNRTLSKTSSAWARTQISMLAPVKRFVSRRFRDGRREVTAVYDSPSDLGYTSSKVDCKDSHNLQWAQGKAGEDRVHVVLSEEHGWLFVGIYDGFNGPDAPDFLMRNLYRAIYRELRGLLWDRKEDFDFTNVPNATEENDSLAMNNKETDEADGYAVGEAIEAFSRNLSSATNVEVELLEHRVQTSALTEQSANIDADSPVGGQSQHMDNCKGIGVMDPSADGQGPGMPQQLMDRVRTENSDAHPSNENSEGVKHQNTSISSPEYQADAGALCDHRTNLDAESESGTDEKRTQIKSSSPDIIINNFRPKRNFRPWKGRSLFRPELRHRHSRNKESHRKLFPWSNVAEHDRKERDKPQVQESKQGEFKQCRHSAVDHSAVLKALARALEATEKAYLEMADHSMEENPELALMGSCILVMLMKDEDVYVMNVGDSRAIVAQNRRYECHPLSSRGDPPSNSPDSAERIGARDSLLRLDLERIIEETPTELEAFETPYSSSNVGPPTSSLLLNALQLSIDHSTSIEAEIDRIKAEHPDDNLSILNDRVKGRLKVTRAFGAGFLKEPRWNNAILEMFRIDYVGSSPYINCTPALHHHRLGADDRFLILSSDGLYQYLTNQEVVSHVAWFMERFPEGDPAQHLIEELLFRAAKKAGMDFHELLDIPQGDRRKYHDDVSVMVISLEGRIWRSSG